MPAQPIIHPSADTLQAFAFGKLSDTAASDTVVQHLETCADCRERVKSLSGDSFMKRVQDARQRTQLPGARSQVSDQAQASNTGGQPAPRVVPDLPSEFRNHPQYEVLRELGAGGMGVVYLAKNKLMDRLEVLKVISTAMVNKPGVLDRFLREIRAAAALSHDNVVKAYTALPMGELFVFAMEYVEGDDLAKAVKTQGPLPVANASYYARQVALGLQHAHDKGMVHRDIKPHNLILARVGKKHIVKILDFGLAKAASEKKVDAGLTGEGKMLGTPDYMAPEQILDAARADIRADIYSLGCTLYYLLTGAPPFDANSLFELLQSHQTQEARPLNLVRPEVPVELARVVAKMMAKEPGKRYQKPVEVAQALMPFVVKPATKAPDAPPSVSAGKSAKAQPSRPDIAAKRSETVAAERPDTLQPSAKAPANPFSFAPEPMVQKTAPKKAKTPLQLRLKPLHLAGVAAGFVLLVLLLWATGVLRVATSDGVLVVQVNEQNADVFVDGPQVTVTWEAGGKKAEIRVKPGTHQVSVSKDGFTAHGETVTLEEGGRQFIKATLTRRAMNVGKAQPTVVSATPHLPGWVDEKWLREVSGLPADQQVAAVRAMLPLRNPGFEGTVKHQSANGVVTAIELNGAAVHDLSPLLVFTDLQTLDCSCPDPWQSPLADLSLLARLPLRSMRYPYHTWLGAEQLRSIKTLETINDQPAATFWKKVDAEAAEFKIFRQLVAGLSPQAQEKAVANRLKERNPGFDGKMSSKIENGVLVEVAFSTDAMVDISPVRVLPGLQRLNLGAPNDKGKLADLTPLHGVALTWLHLVNCSQVRDLTPLQGMKLTYLNLGNCVQVRDLLPLRGMPLTFLGLWRNMQVSDLTPLQGMPLTNLDLNSCVQVRDLSPLKGLKLTSLTLTACGAVLDLTPLKNMPLTHLNLWGCRQLRDLTPLKGLKLTWLSLAHCSQVQDLSLLQGMKLNWLNLNGCAQLRDLSLLQGMKLTWLDLGDCVQVNDLTPLQGMPLKYLSLGGCGQLRDLTPLQEMSLEFIYFTPKNITKGVEGIRRMQSLKRIGIHWAENQQYPATEFWKRYDAGEFTKPGQLGVRNPSEAKTVPDTRLPTDGFVPLFNGKDLTGWQTHFKQPGNWRVVNSPGGGILTGSGTAASHLYMVRRDYKDFHLRAEARINDGGDSGIFFRTRFGPTPDGYEAQINSTRDYPSKTGSLQGRGDLVVIRESPVPPGEWFTLEVIAEGIHIVVKVNGKVTADYRDEQRRFMSGTIALQQYLPQTVAEFRKIEIKELTASALNQGFSPADPKLRLAHENRGDWRIDADELVQESGKIEDCGLRFGDFSWKDYDFTMEAKKISGRGEVGMFYRATAEGTGRFTIGTYDGTWESAKSYEGPFSARLRERRTVPMEKDRWYKLGVRVRGAHYQCFLDDQVVLEFDDQKHPQGEVGLWTWWTTARFRNLRVTDPAGKVLWQGLPVL